mgnify:CR=1 FL=1
MGWFGNKKRFIDLSEGYRSPAKKIPAKSADTNFFSDMANSSDSSSTSDNVSWDNDTPTTTGEYQNKKPPFY